MEEARTGDAVRVGRVVRKTVTFDFKKREIVAELRRRIERFRRGRDEGA